ncbi:protein DpdD [Micromonospora coerulea]|uniref:protein DpdD n=1 Tax=Micromonospora coerulea TaxID=47856 RepID=UPI00190357AE|nr:protein DpdD [Micromonospora veneta]
MTVLEALQVGVGDPARFKGLRERVEMLVEGQAQNWVSGSNGWLVVPLQRHPQGFYLLSEDREGQRRGREVLQAFLGPATATLEAVQLSASAEQADRSLQAAGLVQLSYVRRVDAAPGELLDRLEDAVATAKGRDARIRPIRPSHVDLLRDFRLALLQRDGRLAEQALRDLRLTGQLSAENLRFLRIELLGQLERWRELRELPYLAELLRARRPRVVNEVLLDMLWWTEVADLCAAGLAPQNVHEDAQLGARYGAVLGAVDVPANAGGRAVAAVDALTRRDDERFQRLLHAADNAERERLHRLAALAQTTPQPTETAGDDVRALFENRQYEAVVQAFLDMADPDIAEFAVQAVLDIQDSGNAPAVLEIVQRLVEEERVSLDRRLRRDVDDLAQFVDSTCDGWVEWGSRLSRDERWPGAAEVLRAHHAQWEGLRTLPASMLSELANGILDAWTGINADQVAMALDLLCLAAAETASTAQAAEFCDTVLEVLAEQQNVSPPVREAYLVLLDQLLQAAPAEARYRELLAQAADLWRRVASPTMFDWGLGLVEVLLNTPAPDPGSQVATVMEVLGRAQDFRKRLNQRQRSELEALAEEVGLPLQSAEEPTEETDGLWRQLDGRVVGLYSLLPRAAESLEKRLSRLCSPKAIEGNADTVSTTALQSLARRADYLIVDTWHASHSATGAIDAARPRSRQILPRGRGVTAFLQALEHSLSLTATDS